MARVRYSKNGAAVKFFWPFLFCDGFSYHPFEPYLVNILKVLVPASPIQPALYVVARVKVI